jgi:hypothetical protein
MGQTEYQGIGPGGIYDHKINAKIPGKAMIMALESRRFAHGLF